MGFPQRIMIKTRLVLTFTLLVVFFVVFGMFSFLEMNKSGELRSNGLMESLNIAVRPDEDL